MGRIIKAKHGPEWFIQRDFVAYLRARHWLVERTHGNAYQQGFPDIYVAHKKYGTRWVDLKNPNSYVMTKAQRSKWPEWESYGIGVWIITGSDQENYDKLFKPPNFRDYWKDSYGDLPDIDQVLDEIKCDS